ncbi:MAG TPA: PA2779 family protein [Burkholderiaceae bacterium]|nr:PA2779 family protein [Burkholderiaceae bacterium]
MRQTFRRAFVHIVMAAFIFTGFMQATQAAMISTDQIHAEASAQQNHDRIAAALNRPEVMSQLEKMGVTKVDAQARVAALTDTEVATVAEQMDSLPAGGDGILGALVLIFVVLLVTDILGLTKVFPFTRSIHR